MNWPLYIVWLVISTALLAGSCLVAFRMTLRGANDPSLLRGYALIVGALTFGVVVLVVFYKVTDLIFPGR